MHTNLYLQIYLSNSGGKMYINFASDWPAYLFMMLFAFLFVYIIIKGNSKKDVGGVEKKK
jgi:hypothetical protein